MGEYKYYKGKCGNGLLKERQNKAERKSRLDAMLYITVYRGDSWPTVMNTIASVDNVHVEPFE